jgi:uncharacterized protein (TIGR02996 family)
MTATATPPRARSHEDEAFLAAIYDRLDDDLPKLVYADWLAECGRTKEEAFWKAAAAEEWRVKTGGWVTFVTVQKALDITTSLAHGKHCHEIWSDQSTKRHGRVPHEVMKRMPGYRGEDVSKELDFREYPTAAEAWAALRDAWIEVNFPGGKT